MTDKQFNQLIYSIEAYANESPWVDFWFPLFAVFIGSLTAYMVARYQVNKSNEQEAKYRKQDIARQKSFSINEMKLEMSQKILDLTTVVNKNVINMMNMGNKRYNKLIGKMFFENEVNTNKIDGNPTIEEKIEILNIFETIQYYLSSLYTVMELFDFETEEKENFSVLSKKLNELHKQCSGNPIESFTNIENLGQECLNTIGDFDYKVRQKYIDLIYSMKRESKLDSK